MAKFDLCWHILHTPQKHHTITEVCLPQSLTGRHGPPIWDTSAIRWRVVPPPEHSIDSAKKALRNCIADLHVAVERSDPGLAIKACKKMRSHIITLARDRSEE